MPRASTLEPELLSSEPHLLLNPHSKRSLRPAWLIPLLVIFGAALVTILVAGALVLVLLTRTHAVTLVVDGDIRQIDTYAQNVSQLLSEANVALNDGDVLSAPLDESLDVTDYVTIDRARSVFLVVDGETTPLWTSLTNPSGILASAGVVVGVDDHIQIDGTDARIADLAAWPVPVSTILVRHAVTLRIHDEGSTQTVRTTGATVGEALFEAGITLYLTDSTAPDMNAPLTGDLDVTITRARPVEIIADGETIRTRSRGTTVADALVDAGVALVGMDYAIPAERTPLQPGMSIRVIRVRESIEAEQQSVPFETVYQADATIELDQERVVQQGQPGVQERRIRVRYENGSPVSRSDEETVIVQPPVNREIHYGTNVVIRTIDTPEGSREYWRVLRMYVTSYHPVDGDNITATGHVLQKGIVGSDPTVLPYGTQVYVPDYGVGEVQDTGGRRSMPLWLDLGYTNEDYRGWYGYHDVYILTPVPEHIDYTLPGT